MLVKNGVRNQFGRVAAYLASPYWCVYSAQCRVRLLLVCVQCTLQNENVTVSLAKHKFTSLMMVVKTETFRSILT